MSFPRDYQLKIYKDQVYVTALPNYHKALSKIISDDRTLIIDNRRVYRTTAQVNSMLNKMIDSNASDLLRIVVVFDKLQGTPSDVGIMVKMGNSSEGKPLFTNVIVHRNCSIQVDRSESGTTEI